MASKKKGQTEKSVDAILKRTVSGKWSAEKQSNKNIEDALKHTMAVLTRSKARK